VERREVDLWPLVEALVHDLHPLAGTSSAQLINQVPDDLVVYADAGLLRRIFQNSKYRKVSSALLLSLG
jgi:two-component system phosphate regulon sensor histidine kinase PhoR